MKKGASTFTGPACLASLLLLATAALFAADPTPTPQPVATGAPGDNLSALTPANVRIDVLMIAMPEEKFVTLMPDLTDRDEIEKLIPELLDAVKKKEMILEGYPMITTKSGQRAVAETVKEVSYHVDPAPTPTPTPTAQPDNSGSAATSGSDAGTSGAAPAVSGTGSAPSGTQPAVSDAQTRLAASVRPNVSYVPVDPAPPSEFETRNIGVTLEVEPIVSPDGHFIDLNLAPQHIQLLGFRVPPKPGQKEGPLESEDARPIKGQPIFYEMKDTTSVTLRNGEHKLLGIHKTVRPEGYVEIFIVHAEVLTIDK